MIEGDEEDELLAEDHTKSTSYYLSKIFGESSFIVTLFQSTFHPDFAKLDNVFYASFARDKKHFFESSHDWYFSKSTRERILDFLLKRKRFSDNLNDDFAFGIARLIKLGVYTDAYPLHDGSLEDEGDQPLSDLLPPHIEIQVRTGLGYTGGGGGSPTGSSSSRWTPSGSTTGSRSLSTSPGWASSPRC